MNFRILIKTVKINSLSVDFDNDHKSVAWAGFHKEKMLLLTFLWLLDKYKDFPEIVRNIIMSIGLMKEYYNSYSEIINEVSYETLDNNDEETKMKNILIGGLVMFLLAGIVGCNSGTGSNDIKEEEDTRVIEEKYRGTYETNSSTKLHLTETHYYLGGSFNIDGTEVSGNIIRSARAYTEGNELKETRIGSKARERPPITHDGLIGKFNDDGTFDEVYGSNPVKGWKKKE